MEKNRGALTGDSFRRKRPTFEQFKTLFMEEVSRRANNGIGDTYCSWFSVGDEQMRGEIIDSFVLLLEKRYSVAPVLNEPLSGLEAPIESVINRIYHVFSSMLLVEHINEKMYGKREQILN